MFEICCNIKAVWRNAKKLCLHSVSCKVFSVQCSVRVINFCLKKVMKNLVQVINYSIYSLVFIEK